MTVEYRPVTSARLTELETVFGTHPTAQKCWCMWFVLPVTRFHANGVDGNRAAFAATAAAAEQAGQPVGVLAVDGDDDGVVGWCAAGPRSRYARALRTPTYHGRDAAEDDAVWLVPCFFVRPDRRRSGIAAGLLAAAVALAADGGASAVEGFPMAADGPRTGSDRQVGDERVFAEQGFRAVRRPTRNRVVMRREM